MKIDASVYRSFGRLQRLVLFTVAFSAEELPRRVLTTLVAGLLGIGRRDVGAVGDDFVQRGILLAWRTYGNVEGFKTEAKFTLDALREMVKEADDQRWWADETTLKQLWQHCRSRRGLRRRGARQTNSSGP